MFVYRTFSDRCIVEVIKGGIGYRIEVIHNNIRVVVIEVVMDGVFDEIYGEFFLGIVMRDIIHMMILDLKEKYIEIMYPLKDSVLRWWSKRWLLIMRTTPA